MINNKPVYHAGLEGVQAAPVVTRILQEAGNGTKTIVVTASQGAAVSFAKNLAFFVDTDRCQIVALPDDDPPFLCTLARSRESEEARLKAMTALTSGGSAIVVCPVSMAIRDICRPDTFLRSTIAFGAAPEGSAGCDRNGESLSRDALIKRLSGNGYRRVPNTENTGEFSARGDIIDIFPVNHEAPYRISFFDIEIESVRTFDPETQKTYGGTHAYIAIGPAKEPDPEGLMLADWLDDNETIICLDPVRVLRALELRETEAMHDFETLVMDGDITEAEWNEFRSKNDWLGLIARKKFHSFIPYRELPDGDEYKDYAITQYEAKYIAAFYGQLELLAAELKRYIRQNFTITIVASSETRLTSIRKFAEQEKIAEKICFKCGELTAGFELTSERSVWLWDGDIFKSGKKSRRTHVKGHEKISAFTDIEKGDYIVHEKHGIGIFKGIRTLEAYGVSRDYLTIAYSGKDVLYLPVEQMDRIQKYVGGGEKKPRVSRLGSDDWTRTKARVRAEIEEYAVELIRLAAERKVSPGFAFSPDTVWQKDFEDRFPWIPTPDQLRCFEAVRKDMENPWPMDRLICGDVGYGKTEVALRAVFKCVQDGKQAIVLVPTTILAAQHFRTFSERFADFPVRVEMLSRFRSARAKNEIISGLKTGDIDVVIGTHALISSKIACKDAGLLVIDEEQRFGVRHKEKIRAMKAGVDVLTLTATPIPRTLNMSLLGIKDMELIEDPPEDRYPVRTYVTEERAEVISESIRRELDRDGQVYVVYNRVEGIERVSEQIRNLVPQARVAVCHAKMNERMIEEIMQAFYESMYDVLLSTTIIESGLDIPNVNTIIILDADRLGLTQLYQLRGRVGRTNRIAFAYLMYRQDKVLTETAEKRLRTIRDFTEFGSGFKIAMKDLEIRGAGNLLGVSQHGHMAAVGYEMYCKLMDETVAKLAGEAAAQTSAENECKVELSVAAVIPQGYIEDEVVKLQAYKRISFVGDEDSKATALEELRDRFGSVPPSVLALVYAAYFRHLGENAGLADIKMGTNRAEFVYRETPADIVKRVFIASEKARAKGASLEADLKFTPKLMLYLPETMSIEIQFETVVAALTALSG